MNREKLISYSCFYNGEYDRIIKAISNNEKVKDVNIKNVITVFDKEYPSRLLDLRYPPLVLYYYGDLSLLNKECVGIVGSRKPCDYAIEATKRLSKKLSDKVIVSGLAKGVDYYAQDNALKTIGILGCGIDYIYPMCNYDLINKVKKEGLLLSEYPSMVKPLAYHFPFRNRIIAALSSTIYIMQSSQKSGTMTTINEALELGKDIKVLPYDVFNSNGINNNDLINEGAMLICNEEIAF